MTVWPIHYRSYGLYHQHPCCHTVFSWNIPVSAQDALTFSHYSDVIMGTKASQITSLTIVYSTVYSDADQRKHQSSASLAFVLEIHQGPVNSPHKWPVTQKMFPFDDVIMTWETHVILYRYIYIYVPCSILLLQMALETSVLERCHLLIPFNFLTMIAQWLLCFQ